ncbi:MAG: tyrosine-type recombinase/integrase [Candidatus Obscuribacterales bacterium]|nr:tyrosine-type recombinase/integrase [Candidatus Obscuribacterales bacterium]
MKTTSLKAPDSPLEKYASWLKRQPLSDHTARAYRSRIKRFLAFLDASGEVLESLLNNDRELAHVLKNYKRHLKQVDKSSPATVNAHLTAIDHYLQFLGSKAPEIPREDLPQEAPVALEKEEEYRLLRSVAACRRSMDRAVVLLMCHSGIRIGECAALDVDDVFVVGRKRKLIVRNGKGDFYREIPLNNDAAEAVLEWLTDRKTKYEGKDADRALFVNPQGKRLSTASLDLIVRKVGQACGLVLSAHTLRHTLLTKLIRSGNDLVLVAEIGGHKRLETTRRYTLPRSADKEKAMAGLLNQ